jgi:hypothetical protein
MTDQQLADLKNVHKIQGSHGNWDYDPYMHGMFNGLELALAIVEGREPKYKSAPAHWLSESEGSRTNLTTLHAEAEGSSKEKSR